MIKRLCYTCSNCDDLFFCQCGGGGADTTTTTGAVSDSSRFTVQPVQPATGNSQVEEVGEAAPTHLSRFQVRSVPDTNPPQLTVPAVGVPAAGPPTDHSEGTSSGGNSTPFSNATPTATVNHKAAPAPNTVYAHDGTK